VRAPRTRLSSSEIEIQFLIMILPGVLLEARVKLCLTLSTNLDNRSTEILERSLCLTVLYLKRKETVFPSRGGPRKRKCGPWTSTAFPAPAYAIASSRSPGGRNNEKSRRNGEYLERDLMRDPSIDFPPRT